MSTPRAPVSGLSLALTLLAPGANAAERYERGSVLPMSKLTFSKFDQIFKDATTTAAAFDRLVHHSVVIQLNVPNDRVETAELIDAEQFSFPQSPGAVPSRPQRTHQARDVGSSRTDQDRGRAD